MSMYMWVTTMKRLLIITVVLAFLAAATPASAIGSRAKLQARSAVADSAAVRKAPATKTSKQSLLDRLKRDVREAQKTTKPNATDNYIDANNDGVDDRVKEKSKAEPQGSVKAAPMSVRKSEPSKRDSSATSSKKKRKPN